MIEEKNGFAFLEGQLLFSLTPEDIVWRMRDGWLNDIQKGNNVLVDVILPYLEREAISRLGKEWTIQKESAPSMKGGYDNWRLWWLNEASHNCDSHDPIGEAGRHLSPIGQHAVNILITASALRDALDAGNATESAALAMMLICEALAGGHQC